VLSREGDKMPYSRKRYGSRAKYHKYKRCVRKVARKGTAVSPHAVCRASIYGKIKGKIGEYKTKKALAEQKRLSKQSLRVERQLKLERQRASLAKKRDELRRLKAASFKRSGIGRAADSFVRFAESQVQAPKKRKRRRKTPRSVFDIDIGL
jgi:hypothetical protein